MAIACFVDRAPCLPSRTWWISSRTNSPACVLFAFPWRLSLAARRRVSLSGIRGLLLIAGFLRLRRYRHIECLLRAKGLVIVACEHDQECVWTRSQFVKTQLRGGRGDNGSLIELVMKMTL